jgi:hypothetical protein
MKPKTGMPNDADRSAQGAICLPTAAIQWMTVLIGGQRQLHAIAIPDCNSIEFCKVGSTLQVVQAWPWGKRSTRCWPCVPQSGVLLICFVLEHRKKHKEAEG